MTPAELAAAVLANPEALWRVRTSRRRIAGPWVPATRPGYSIGGDGEWRCTPNGKDIAVIHRWWQGCDGIQRPRASDYGLDDREEYEAACAAYEAAAAVRAGRVWVYYADEERGYAASPEEARALADAKLRARDVLLLDALPHTDG